MSPEKDKHLCESFPDLYADRNKSMRETCMSFGFSVGNGWYELLYFLSADLTKMINKLPIEERKKYKAFQVKEKYGSLRFYMTEYTPEMDDRIHVAELRSLRICERCGEKGNLVESNNWYKVLCKKCIDEDKKNGKTWHA